MGRKLRSRLNILIVLGLLLIFFAFMPHTPLDPTAFSVLPQQFAKDDKYVYAQDQILKKANPATFEVLKNHYARDDKHMYFVNRVIAADVKTFIVLEDGYAKDHLHLFCLGNIVKEQL